MRGTKAKRLRRLSESLTPGRPARAYQRTAGSGVIRLAPGCTRKVYQDFKNPDWVKEWLKARARA